VKQVFDQARTLYGIVQDDLLKQQHPDAFKAVQNLRAGLEQLSGYPVRVTDGEFKDKTSPMSRARRKTFTPSSILAGRCGRAANPCPSAKFFRTGTPCCNDLLPITRRR
jgi:hypothetical protein